MSLFQIIYASRPFGFDSAMLNGILSDARRNNQQNEVTGALICRAEAYLQLIEGPEMAVRGTFARIAKDDRHTDVNLLFGEPLTDRIFPYWAMRVDPAHTWMWTQEQVANGAIAAATRAEVLAVFDRLKFQPS